MKSYRIPQTDLIVSRIAYGCAGLASWDGASVGSDDVASAARVIDTVRAQGINLFDHADLYGLGRAELVFGKLLKQSPSLRDQIVIQSKCGQRVPQGWQPGDPVEIDSTHAHIVAAVEGSLERLRTDRLDILLLHLADALVRPQEVAQAFDELHRAGKVRSFGVSNHNAQQLQLLKKDVRQPLVVNQIRIGLGFSHFLTEGMEFAVQLAAGPREDRYRPVASSGTIEYCRLNDIQIQAYSPLRGLLRLLDETRSEFRALARLLVDLSKRHGSTPSAVALAWLLHHPAGIIPVIGSGKHEQLIENCDADRLALTNREWYDLFAAAAQLQS